MKQVFKGLSDQFKIEIETGDDEIPARLRLRCNPCPIYFAFKYHSLLPQRESTRRQLQEMIISFIRMLERDLMEAIPSEFK